MGKTLYRTLFLYIVKYHCDMFLKPCRNKYLRKKQIKDCNKKSPKVEKKDKLCKRRKTTILENAK